MLLCRLPCVLILMHIHSLLSALAGSKTSWPTKFSLVAPCGENLLASVVAETSSRTELEERANELVNSFHFVAERVDVIDDWLSTRFGQ